MKPNGDLASVVAQQARAIADLQQRLAAREGHKDSSWLRAFSVSPNLRLLGLCVLVVSAGACCLGAKGTGMATFDNVQIDGTCTGCGPEIYYLTEVICRRRVPLLLARTPLTLALARPHVQCVSHACMRPWCECPGVTD